MGQVSKGIEYMFFSNFCIPVTQCLFSQENSYFLSYQFSHTDCKSVLHIQDYI